MKVIYVIKYYELGKYHTEEFDTFEDMASMITEINENPSMEFVSFKTRNEEE